MNSHEADSALSIESLPLDLSELYRYLNPTPQSLALRAYVEKAGPLSQIDYDALAIDFNQAFFIRNFLKCFFYLRSHVSLVGRDVVDVGGGAGAFSLAARMTREESYCTIVDRCAAQLSRARYFSGPLRLNHIDEYVKRDVRDTRLPPGSTRVLSYWACENLDWLLLPRGIYQSFSRSRCFIIDYPDVVSKVTDRVRECEGIILDLTLNQKVSLDADLSEIIDQEQVSLSGACFEFDH